MEKYRVRGFETSVPSIIPFYIKQNRTFKMYQLVKQYKVLIPTREDW
jgi:hypothetical protein